MLLFKANFTRAVKLLTKNIWLQIARVVMDYNAERLGPHFSKSASCKNCQKLAKINEVFFSCCYWSIVRERRYSIRILAQFRLNAKQIPLTYMIVVL